MFAGSVPGGSGDYTVESVTPLALCERTTRLPPQKIVEVPIQGLSGHLFIAVYCWRLAQTIERLAPETTLGLYNS